MSKVAIGLAVWLGVSVQANAAIGTVGGLSSGALPRGDVICDFTTGVATGTGAGTCLAQPAACNGDAIQVTRTVTITSGAGGNKYLATSTSTFSGGDVNKAIIIPGAGSGNNVYYGTIASVTDAQNIVLTTAVTTVLNSVSTVLTYGTNDAQALADFSTWANLTWQASHSGLIEQYIPSGKGCQILSQVNLTASLFEPGCASPSTYPYPCGWGSGGWAKGIKQFLMNFSGSSLKNWATLVNATSATIANAGSGYTNGSQLLTVSGGNCTIQPQFTVTVSGNVLTGTPALTTPGSCITAPGSNSVVTGGGGTGGRLNVSASQPLSFVTNGGDGVCHNGINSVRGCSARTASASVGATSVTLLDTALCSRFTTGGYAVMTGFAIQALYSASSSFGYPPNFAFYDYAIITDISNCASTGQITLDRALTNDYLSTWPNNAPGSTGEVDQAGPATLYMLPFWWNSEAEYRGGTFSNGSNQTNGGGRQTVFRNVTWIDGVNCPYATQAITWNIIGGDWSICNIEMDKIVVNSLFQNANIGALNYQSMSPRYQVVDNTVVGQQSGTPRNINYINNSSVTSPGDFNIGATGFGRTDSFNASNFTTNTVLAPGGAQETGAVSAGNWALVGQSGGPYNATMTNGIITVPNTHGAVTWGVPGTNFMWGIPGNERIANYQVLDVTQDATNQYVTTNCVGVNTVCGVGGGLPIASGTLRIAVHPAPKFNCTNCSGTALWAAVSNGPTDAPLFSYQKYTVTNAFQTTTTNFVRTWGFASSLVFTVNTPYAGGGALNFRPTRSDVYGVVSQAGATGSYIPSIDLKTAGTRTINSSGVCTGCAGADSITFTFTPQWFAGVTAPSISSFQSGWSGTLDVTMTFDQGVVNP